MLRDAFESAISLIKDHFAQRLGRPVRGFVLFVEDNDDCEISIMSPDDAYGTAAAAAQMLQQLEPKLRELQERRRPN